MSYLAALLILVSAAAAQTAPRPLQVTPTTRKIEYQAIRVGSHGDESPVNCAQFTEPDAKDTPNPVLASGANVVVDVVLAWDGKVYSPFIEQADGIRSGEAVLRVVRTWRFSPALCNGSPINTEVTIKFRR
jgi:TonB family protein